MSGSFVRRTEKVARQSVRQLKIFISRLALQQCCAVGTTELHLTHFKLRSIGSINFSSTETSESSSTTSADSLETSTATIVQELDSSKRRSISPDTTQENEHTKENFTIIHIPDEQSSSNTSSIAPVYMTTDAANLTCQTNSQEMKDKTSTELTIEQQFAIMVENLDLDLIVKTYEALQSSDNVEALIENWLADSREDREDGVNKLTLEENLKRFIEFSQKS